MEASETPERAGRAAEPGGRRLGIPALDWGAIPTWLLAALLVVYLSLENGGYDPTTRLLTVTD